MQRPKWEGVREGAREALGFRVYACSAIASLPQAHVAFQGISEPSRRHKADLIVENCARL